MNIIIVGCGKVGYTIAKHLSTEKNIDVTVIDKKHDIFDQIIESIDVLFIKGNGLTSKILLEASVKNADLIICVTDSDEANILCCVTAKKLGAKTAIARVRDPEYFQELYELRKTLGVDLILNPEQQAALEISRLLRFPSASDIETFIGGRVELVAFKVEEGNYLVGKKISESFRKIKLPVLAAQIQRDKELIIPSGDDVVLAGDMLRILGRPSYITDFFHHLGINTQKVRNVMIIGGGKISFYLTQFLSKHKIDVKIIEKDADRCDKLSEDLPGATIIHGDGTNEELIDSEGLDSTGAAVYLTDRDEENVIMGLYAKQCGVSKTIVKINHINPGLVRNLDLGSVVCPKNTTAYQIIRYVRGLSNSINCSNIKTMYRLADSGDEYVEALEFDVLEKSRCVGKKLKDLSIKKNVLVGCIARSSNVIIANGETIIEEGDSVIVLAKTENMSELDDILTTDIRNTLGVITK